MRGLSNLVVRTLQESAGVSPVDVVEAGGSMNDHISFIHKAWQKARSSDPYSTVLDVFPEHIIIAHGRWDDPARKTYMVGYVADGDTVEFEMSDLWTEVRLDYVPVGADEAESDDVMESFRGLVEADADGNLEAVIVTEGESRRGNVYLRKSLPTGISVFSGAKMYADHPSASEERERPERSVRHLVGKLGEAYVGTDKNGKAALRAPVILSKTAGWLNTLISEGIAGDLSIRAKGVGKRSAEGRFIVEAFRENPHTSVDFVTVASAGGYMDLREAAQDDFWETISREDLQKRRPDLIEEAAPDGVVETRLLVEGDDFDMADKDLQEALDELHQLRKANAQLFRTVRESEARTVLDDALNGANLPNAAVARLREAAAARIDAYGTHGSEESLDQLAESFNGMVQAERDYLAKVGQHGVVGTVGAASGAGRVDADAVLEEAWTEFFDGDEQSAKRAMRGRR